MTINWGALSVVAAVSLVIGVLIVVLVSLALVGLSARVPDQPGEPADEAPVIGRTGSGLEDGGADPRRLLVARVVIGDDDPIGALRRDRAHQRALAGVAVAPGAEHHHQPTLHIGSQRRQGLFQRVGLMRVIDKDLELAFCRNELETSRHLG